MEKMDGRGAGLTCIDNMNRILPNGKNWKAINFAKNGGGCGASMRAACIGLYFYKDMDKLIEVSI